jgi:hypothetical protein
MSSFTTPLILTPLDDGERWRLVEPFEYHVGEEGSGSMIRVPAGFETDFASVPRFFWRILPPWGRYGKAAVVHDYLYGSHACTRERADEIFLEAMTVLGVPAWKRNVMYRAVRWFGQAAWDEKGA